MKRLNLPDWVGSLLTVLVVAIVSDIAITPVATMVPAYLLVPSLYIVAVVLIWIVVWAKERRLIPWQVWAVFAPALAGLACLLYGRSREKLDDAQWGMWYLVGFAWVVVAGLVMVVLLRVLPDRTKEEAG